MTKLTLQDVFDMFEPFGIPAARVIAVLNSCENKEEAAAAFEDLKLIVTKRYEKGEAIELESIYKRLMNISLKNYTPPKPEDSGVDAKVRQAAKIHELLKEKDIAGISKLLGEDPVDGEDQQNIISDIISRFTKRK